MNRLTVCYSTHRLETLELTARVMHDHDLIVLEEPPHHNFAEMINGNIDISDHLLELDTGYPEFNFGQYQLLQQMSKTGKQIVQVEPYLENLIRIQYFFAEGHTPAEIEPHTIGYTVYCAERDATGLLIDYYKEVRGDDFAQILERMNGFAKADAARFVLRDSLRVEGILKLLAGEKDIYIEAGSIHLLLYRLLLKRIVKPWHLHLHSVDRVAIRALGNRGSLFSPGDTLTLCYILGHKVSPQKWQLECARSLIYSKIVTKEEMVPADTTFPHTRNELASIATVKMLSIENCRTLFQRIRTLSTQEAAIEVETYTKKQKRVRP